jgi:hypothetical protein
MEFIEPSVAVEVFSICTANTVCTHQTRALLSIWNMTSAVEEPNSYFLLINLYLNIHVSKAYHIVKAK